MHSNTVVAVPPAPAETHKTPKQCGKVNTRRLKSTFACVIVALRTLARFIKHNRLPDGGFSAQPTVSHTHNTFVIFQFRKIVRKMDFHCELWWLAVHCRRAYGCSLSKWISTCIVSGTRRHVEWNAKDSGIVLEGWNWSICRCWVSGSAAPDNDLIENLTMPLNWQTQPPFLPEGIHQLEYC